MTSPKAKTRDYLAGLPDDWALPDPPREPDMEQHRSVSDFDATLMAHFAYREDVLVAGGGYLRNDPRNESEIFAPDCVVAFGVDPRAIISRNGYVVQHAGKPPDFVLEVASYRTGRRDYTVKRDGYAGYRVREYWRFDHTGGRYHDAPLAGDVLTGEEYTPIPINRDPDGMLWGHSDVLGLDLCWVEGVLRLRDPATGRFLPKPEELRSELDEAQAQANADRQRAESAERRAAELEAELQRLRGE